MIDRVTTEELWDALASIPGTVLPAGMAAWAVRIGPERAWSVARIVERLELLCDPQSRLALGELVAKRDVHRQVLELVERDGAFISVLDEPSIAVEVLRSIPGATACEVAGRVEAPLTPWTAESIRACVATYRLRLSPPAALALRKASTAAARPGAVSDTRPGDQPTTHVAMHPSGDYVVLSAVDRGDLALAFARLPGARSLDRARRQWLLHATVEAARAVRYLLGSTHDVSVDEPAGRWLADAPRWIARVDVAVAGGEPRLTVTTRWGEPPAAMNDLEGFPPERTSGTAELSVSNLRVIGTMLES